MYNILVIDNKIRDIHSKHKIKSLKPENVIKELKTFDYDLIYLNSKYKTEEIEKNILSDFMKLPYILKKLTINNEIESTYISLQIINELIIRNTHDIKFKDYYEEVVTLNIVKQILILQIRISNIINNICPNKVIKDKVEKAIESVIKRNYVRNSLIRRFQYIIFHKKVTEKFFGNIIIDIKKNINELEIL